MVLELAVSAAREALMSRPVVVNRYTCGPPKPGGSFPTRDDIEAAIHTAGACSVVDFDPFVRAATLFGAHGATRHLARRILCCGVPR